MKVENILRVADAIERHEISWLGFNMRFFQADTHNPESLGIEDKSGHSCGTVACIAGWTNAVRTGARTSGNEIEPEDEGDWLGLSELDWDALFYPKNMKMDSWADITQQQAVITLRHLAKTGDVDWSAEACEE